MKNIFNTSVFLTLIFHFAYGQINYDTVYTKTYGNSTFHTEGISVAEISNDNLMLSTGYHGGLNYCDWRPKIYVVNINGDTIWSKLSIPGNGPLIRTFDENFVNAREIKNTSNCSLDTILACKFNINGDTIWSRKYFFGVCNNQVKDIIQTADSGIVIICFFSYTSCSWPSYKSALIKLDVNGNTQWIKYFGSTGETYEGISIVETSSRELGIIFFTIDASGRGYTLIKTDSTGNMLWKNIIYAGGDVAGYCDLDLLPNDAFLVGGKKSSDFIAKVDSGGNVTFFQNYSAKIGGYINVKYLSSQNLYLLISGTFSVINASGIIVWESTNFNTQFKNVIQLNNSDLVGIGYKYTGSTEKIFLVRLKESNASDVNELMNHSTFKIYPNPFSQFAILEFENPMNEKYDLSVYNSLGQQLISTNNIETNQVIIERTNLIDGLYFFQLRSKRVITKGKFVVE